MTDVFAKALLKQFVINKHFETTCNIHSIDFSLYTVLSYNIFEGYKDDMNTCFN